MSAKRILIVEDDQPVLIGIKEILESNGWDVATAIDGEEARLKFESSPTDVVLTDLLMPRLDGIGLLMEVRNLDPDVPVVVITGFGTIERCREALKAGATDFLQKPCEEEEILRILNRAWRRREEQRELDQIAFESNHKLALTVPADVSKRTLVAGKILALVDSATFRHKRWEIRLALDEAFTNAVVHGCRSDPEKYIEVSAEFGAEEGTVVITDPGKGFDVGAVDQSPSGESGGRGLFLIRSFCDRASWENGGRTCRMVFRRGFSNPETDKRTAEAGS